MEKQRSTWRAPLVLLALALGVCLIVITVSLSGVYVVRSSTTQMQETASAFGQQVMKLFNTTPEIIIDRTTILRAHAPVMELVASKHEARHAVNWSHTWLKSTKEITISGELVASVGFDLKEPFRVEFDSESRTVTITHPSPRLLSLQVGELRSSEGSGWWNSITDADRTEALTRFTSDARLSLQKDLALLESARAHLRTQLSTLLNESGLKVVFEEATPATLSDAPQPLAESLP